MYLRRLLHLAGVLARHGLARSAGRWLPGFLARRLPVGLGDEERLKVVFEEMGGTFIKLGQMLSLQPDLVPQRYGDHLFTLLDRVKPFGRDEVERTFAEELNRGTAELFDSFDPEPIATASVGQVHVAYLRGRKVAVKVQRPSVGREFGGDIGLMSATVWAIDRLRVRRLAWLVEPLREFIAWTSEEMDFRREAAYTARVGRNARESPTERVPQVVWKYTTRRILVLEFLDGVTVLNYMRAVERGDAAVLDRLARQGFNPQVFAGNIIHNFLGDVFRHGMFHADLHPANLMILPGNVVGYLDFGITGVLTRYSRHHLITLTLAYTRGDTEGMCESFFKISTVPPGSEEGFRHGLRRMSDEWYDGHGRGRRLRKNFTGVMLDMMTLSRTHGVSPERDVIKYIRSAIAGDGLITRFAPGFDVGSHLEQMCHGHLKWHALGELVSYEALLNWLTRGGSLVQDGPLRAAILIRRLAMGELAVRSAVPAPRGAAPAASRGLRWTGLALLAVVLVVVTGNRAEPGQGALAAWVGLGILVLVVALVTRRAD